LYKKKVVFAVGDLRMGGTQRVQSIIANELYLKDYNIKFFSLRKVKSYFKLLPEVVYPKGAVGIFKFIFILCLTGFKKFILRKTVDMMVVPSKAIIDELIVYVRENDVKTVVLVEQWLLAADRVKKSLPKVKVIGWIHLDIDIYESFHFAKSVDKLKEGFKRCDYLVALTHEDKEKLKKYRKNKVLVFHNPLTMDNKGQKSDLSKKVISFVGRIDINHKGLDYLIDIAKKIDNDWKIHLAGIGLKHEEFKFKKMIKDNQLQEKIIWQGSKKGEELVQHYLNSSIFISLSRFEGFPLVFGEAMLFGLPVIAFANSGSREVTDNGRYGVLIEQGNVDEFCECLKLFMNSKEKQEKYQQLSLERAKSLNLENIIDQWEEII
jgi:glycosyltransferase involved in cell wall biosynthesis